MLPSCNAYFANPCNYITFAVHNLIIIKIQNIMGRGDKRSRKGKIKIGSYGKSRPKPCNERKDKAAAAAKAKEKEA